VKIPVKKHEYDPNKSWEENYRDLERHHIEEVTWLIERLKKIEEGLQELKEPRTPRGRGGPPPWDGGLDI
jgi:hypothetical protein